MFTAYVDDWMTGGRCLRDYTRESLIDECVRHVFYREFGDLIRGRSAPDADRRKAAFAGVMKQVLRVGPTSSERDEVLSAWRGWWERNGDKVYERVVLVPLGAAA